MITMLTEWFNENNKNKKNSDIDIPTTHFNLSEQERKFKKNVDAKLLNLNSGLSPAVKEAYHTLRANFKHALKNEGPKVVLVTSALPDEGKTTSCCNLGIALAQVGSQVLLIDSDLRKPSLHLHFNLILSPGLAEVLSGNDLDLTNIRKTEIDGLSILTAGTSDENPAEVLGSDFMEVLIKNLAPKYDYILIDMPPVNLVADVISLSKIADGVLIVVRENETRHSEFQRALASLQFAGAKVLGAVLNDADIGRINGTRYGYKKYNKYYR